MPELPEVETVVRGLRDTIIGKTIARVSFDWDNSFPNSDQSVADHLIGATIERVSRRGKIIRIDLASGWALLVHLKMTGQLVYDLDRFPDSTTRVTLTFDDQTKLYFNDQRKFGWMRLIDQALISSLDGIQCLGPEPLSDRFTWEVLRERAVRHARSSIKATLLNQTVLAGMGNIYTDEALFLAKVHPARLTGSLSEAEFRRIHQSIRQVLQHSINLGGSSRQNYLMVDGSKGDYLDDPYVYGRQGQPCRVCGSRLEKSRVAQRGTHTCPRCQPL